MALSREFISIRNSGIIDTIRKTRNTRTKRPSKAISESWIGIRLTTTITVSKIFQPFLKKRFLFSQAINRAMISARKNKVTAQSANKIICSTQGDN